MGNLRVNKARPFEPMNKARSAPKLPMLIILSYWNGDRELARQAAELMADLQPHHVGSVCEVMVSCRQDCKIDQNIVAKLKTRFNTRTHVCTSPLRGWPGGCNGMFGSSMQHVSNSLAHYDCVFWMEADCTPMYTNWFADLYNEWVKRPDGVKIVGCKCDANGNGTGWHITGCALYDPQIARIMPEIAYADSWAWDWGCRDKILKIGSHTNAIGLKYKATELQADILDQRYSVIHGFKNDALLKLVRERRVSGLVSA